MPEWRWRGRDRITGEVSEFFTRGPQSTEAELKDHVQEHYRGLQFVDAWPSDKPPLVLVPVKPRHFEHGILDMVRRELGGKRGKARSFGDFTPILNPLALERSIKNGQIRSSPVERIGGRGLIGSRLRLLRN